jgi:hypothetical protein
MVDFSGGSVYDNNPIRLEVEKTRYVIVVNVAREEASYIILKQRLPSEKDCTMVLSGERIYVNGSSKFELSHACPNGISSHKGYFHSSVATLTNVYYCIQ